MQQLRRGSVESTLTGSTTWHLLLETVQRLSMLGNFMSSGLRSASVYLIRKDPLGVNTIVWYQY